MIATLPILEDDIVKLEPFDSDVDYSYLLDLIESNVYTRLTRDKAEEAIHKFDTHCWNGYDKRCGVKIGVIYLSHITEPCEFWSLDAYRDDRVTKKIDNAMDYSLRAGKLITDYALEELTNVLYTIHYKANRAATIVCKKLGFKIQRDINSPLGKFVMLKKEKLWA